MPFHPSLCHSHVRDYKGMMPFHRAATHGHNELLQLLLSKDRDANIVMERRNKHGATALLAAVAAGHIDCIQTLLDAGAVLTTTDKVRQRPAGERRRCARFLYVGVCARGWAPLVPLLTLLLPPSAPCPFALFTVWTKRAPCRRRQRPRACRQTAPQASLVQRCRGRGRRRCSRQCH